MNKVAKISLIECVFLFVSVLALGWLMGSTLGEVELVSGEFVLSDLNPPAKPLYQPQFTQWNPDVYAAISRDSARIVPQQLGPTRVNAAVKSVTDAAAKEFSKGAVETVSEVTTKELSSGKVGSKSLYPATWFDESITKTVTETTVDGVTTTGTSFTGSGIAIWGDAIATGAQYAVMAYMAGTMIGGFLGFEEGQTAALSNALAAGVGTYGALASEGGAAIFSEGMVANAGWIGLAIGVAVFVATYEETKQELVEFTCLPWQAPTGSDMCEDCNDEDYGCSEYQCKSLGQSCELLNQNTGDEKCVSLNVNDANPPIITMDKDELTLNYKYDEETLSTSPPGPGVKIVRTDAGSNTCLEAFTPITFGFTTDEPSQCRIDINSTTEYDAMASYVAGSNIYDYEHTERLVLPRASDFEASSGIELTNGNEMTLFLRCQDANGNSNEAEYAIRFCVDPTPDTTAPKIDAISADDGSCVAAGIEEGDINFYVNEPAQCKWSFTDKDYDLMEYNMACSNQMNRQLLFPCTATLNGITRDGTDYYVRCKDTEDNTNTRSTKYSLRGSTDLKIKSIIPNENETIYGSIDPLPVDIRVDTLFGCENNGQSVCSFSETGNQGSFIIFEDTENPDGISIQKLYLTSGTYDYTIQCVDDGGNVATEEIQLKVDIDTSPPAVARVYQDDGLLKIVTTTETDCSYNYNDCDFTFDEGTTMPPSGSSTHTTEWAEEETYYIKCRDEFHETPADCSAVIQPTK